MGDHLAGKKPGEGRERRAERQQQAAAAHCCFGGRCSLAALAAAPAPSGYLPQRLAARRGAAMRDLDMQISMGYAEA
jgi:hypothetical protein